MPLTRKQLKFIKEYPKDNNGTQAAIRAGYAKRSAQMQAARMLSKDIIKKELEKEILKQADSADLTIQDVVKGLKSIAQHGEQDGARVNAWAFLGKWLGMHKDKGDSQTTIVLNAPQIAKEKPGGK